MFSNYFKVAFRNILKFKGYSFINIAGLAVGMTCCILIMLWVNDELSYDNFHQNKDRLFRVAKQNIDRGDEKSALTPMPTGPALKEEYTEIVSSTRFSINGPRLIKYDDIKFQDDIVAIADPDYLQMFSFPLIKGDANTALADKFSVIISEKMRDKYFGQVNPIGEILSIDRRDFTVTGIMKDLPQNTHMQFDCLVPFLSNRQYLLDALNNWGASAYYTYVLLHESAIAEEVQQNISGLINQKYPDAEYVIKLHLQSIEEIHLYHDVNDYLKGKGDIKYVYLFSALVFLVLLIACVNFMNLATARAATRIKEIGVRKVIGAGKSDLMKQFFGESLILSFISFVFAITLAELLLPLFNVWSGKNIGWGEIGDLSLILGSVTLVIITGILAGSYPAIFLSSFKPAEVFKSNQKSHKTGSFLRKGLVVFQFALSVFLIITAMVIFEQLDFMQNKDLGFDKDQMINLEMRGSFSENYESIRGTLLHDPSIIDITGGVTPTESFNPAIDVTWSDKVEGENNDDEIVWQFGHVANNYIEVYGLELSEGHSFIDKNQTNDAAGFILNETAVNMMGPNSPIGKYFSFKSYEDNIVPTPHEGLIIGVVKDFHNSSLYESVAPMILIHNPQMLYSLSARIDAGSNERAINLLKNKWREYAPEFPFEYSFVDETLDNFYGTEKRLGAIFAWSTWLAIFISCLGLFGLASFAAERRKKEIG
ncbi:MAG: FtsX-like permease family protein, partial [candidate division Zixibacteria bacterium]|nr:FtsX-like permease family protein [candidate division Zixibacteria bacterium]